MTIEASLKTFALDELKKLSRIPSVSFEGFDPKNVEESGRATADLLKRCGYDRVELKKIGNSHPFVIGEKIVDPKKKTLLLYAHHDVQPEGRREVWKTDPFEPTEINGRLYGRGTADDKAGVLIHAAALKYFMDTAGKPPVNLKVIIDGEEECGSEHLLPFLKENFERLKADIIVVTDTSNIDTGVPSMTVSLRGIVVVDVAVRALKATVHSGMWGGAVPDPTTILVRMLSKLVDDEGNIQLKSVKMMGPSTVGNIPITKAEFAKQAGVLKADAIPNDFYHRNWNTASFSINAIQASSEKLANNVINDRAFARIGIRVSDKENAGDVVNELLQKLRDLCPKTVELELKTQGATNAWRTDPKNPKNRYAFEAAEKALKTAFGRESVYIGCGGSIPFIAPFEEAMKAPVLSIGIEDPYTLAHGENESMELADFYKAIDAEIELFKNLGSA